MFCKIIILREFPGNLLSVIAVVILVYFDVLIFVFNVNMFCCVSDIIKKKMLNFEHLFSLQSF